jgi:excinuclease ABC subunit C
VYKFRDAYGRVVYVGKANNLRARLANYFQPIASLHPRTQQMVRTAASVEWTVVGTEVEALALEYSWIKLFEPRFNLKYRDDKSYPYLALTLQEDFPRAQVMRGKKLKGVKYYGPFGHAWAIRETLDLMTRVFPVRTCSATVFQRYQAQGRACLLGYIDKCAAPCVGRVDAQTYRDIVNDFMAFLDGDTVRFLEGIEAAMHQAAAEEAFERAARLRDDAGALRRVIERNAVVLPDGTDADVFAIADDALEAAIQMFMVRGGRVRGQRGWIVEKVEDVTPAELAASLLVSVYGEAEAADVPREVLMPLLPEGLPQVIQLLQDRRGAAVKIRVPRRGLGRALAETVQKNADHALALHKMKRSSDLTARSQALAELQEALDLDDAPLRIECYDISHTGGTYQVGSMVVFEDGLPRKSEYRHFNIRGPNGAGAADDTAAMAEVLTRRFRRADAAPAAAGTVIGTVVGPEGGRPTRKHFAYPPNLLVVDGGAPQVGAAQRVLDELGIADVSLIGLAKRLEEVWLPGDAFPLILARGSEGLYLLQRVRDEAHRFAISAHRKKRSKGMTRSALDAIPGLGPAKQRALLKHFGSVKRVRAAAVEDLTAAPGIGPALARRIADHFEPEVLAVDEKLDK